MSKKRMGLMVAWMLSLVLIGAVVHAQLGPISPVTPAKVISGSDFGIRIEGMRGDRPFGSLVVRVNGEWVEADLGTLKPKQLSLK